MEIFIMETGKYSNQINYHKLKVVNKVKELNILEANGIKGNL